MPSGYTMYFSRVGELPTQLTNVQLPFFTSGDDLCQGTSSDMYKEDGWQLVYRDFGSPTAAPPLPFFVLYNRYRAKLRFMFYNAQADSHSYYTASIGFRSGFQTMTTATANFTFSDDTHCFLNDFDPTKTEVVTGTMTTYQGWGHFDVPVAGYDPSLSTKDPIIDVTIKPTDVSSLTMTGAGTMSLDQVLHGMPPAGSQMTASQLLDALKAGYKTYKDTQSFTNDMQAKVADTSNSNQWWYSTAQALVTAGVTAYAPWAGALVGAAMSFIGGSNHAAPAEPLKFTGKMNLAFNGSLTTINTNLIATSFYLNPGSQTPDAYRPLQTINWGLFNLNSKPNLTDNVTITPKYIYYQDGTQRLIGYSYIHRAQLDQLPAITFNANTGMILESEEIALAFSDRAPSAWFTVGASNPVFTWGFNPTIKGLAVRLKYKVNNPTRLEDSEYTVIKVFPVNLTSNEIYN